MIEALRLRLAVEIMAALVAVMLIATLLASWAESEAMLQAALKGVAEDLLGAREALAHGGRAVPGLPVYSAPDLPEGRVRADLTERLSGILAALGSPGGATVIGTGPHSLALAIAGPDLGYLVASMVTPPPLFAFSAQSIAAWLGAVLVGTGGVALLLAERLTAGLRLLERTVSAPDDAEGLPPLVPETGPPERRQVGRLLNLMRSRVAQLVERRLRVVAMAAHDMRGPLQRMKIRAEFLSEDERAMWLGDVEQVSDICDGAIRSVRNAESAEPVQVLRLDEVVLGVVADLRATLLPVDVGRMAALLVEGQPLALKRLFANVVGNAATHGGGARVSMFAEDSEAVVLIEDSGPGLPDEHLERVFEPFFRYEADGRPAIRGTGLGLAIARGVAEQMGGSIRLSNRTEGGLRQEVRLPRRP